MIGERIALPAGMRDHRRLHAFHQANRLAIHVYKSTAGFPASERFGMQAQLRRAAVSVPTNIVEGCAREPEGDLLRFLDIAFASSREVMYLVELSRNLELLTSASAAQLYEECSHVSGMLAELRRVIREAPKRKP